MKAALFLTGACNLACDYCYAAGCPTNAMSQETLQRSLAFLRERAGGSLGLTLIGGEPLLCPDLVRETLCICRSWGDTQVSMAIATNGTMLDQDMLDLCRAHKIQLFLSLDGVKEAHDTHRKTRSGMGSFETVMGRVPDVLRAVPDAQISAVITPETVPWVGESVTFLVSSGFRDISMGLDFSGSWCKADLAALQEQYRAVATFYLQAHREGQAFHLSFLDDHIRTWSSGGKARSACCGIADTILAIGPSGRIYPCLQFVGSDDGSASIGHVTSGLDEQARCRVLCRKHGDPCQDCTLKSRCFHWCGCTNWRATGDIYQPPAILCEHERMVIPLADCLAETLYAEQNPHFLRKFYGHEA